MENTIANKEKFFAQHHGQFIVGEHSNKAVTALNYFDFFDINDAYLKLKSLSNISDEDRDKNISLGETHLRNFNQKQVDYLRSKGYALPFHGLSVSDLENYGWIKINQ